MAVLRHDYAFPFRIDPASRQGQRAGYEAHVEQMVIQLLLTTPGERADLPAFGCGLRGLVFAGASDVVAATAQMLVQEALGRWLADHLTVRAVEVIPPSTTVEENQILIRVSYELVATGAAAQVDVRVT
jgi:phage baseplate assembly protein W